MIFFISLPINILASSKQEDGQTTSAPKKTHIRLKIIFTTAISLIIMLFLIFFKFELGIIFKQ